MRSPVKLAFLLALTFALLGVDAGSAQDDGPDPDLVRAEARRLITQMSSASLDGIWLVAKHLGTLGDPAIPLILDAFEGAASTAKLGLARALLDMDEEDEALETIRALAKAEEERSEIRVRAVQILGKWGQDTDEDLLIDALDETYDPHLKTAQAMALWELTENPRAKRALKDLLRSTDSSLRITGALALAELGDVFSSRRVLEEVRDEPTERGRLARALLDKFEWQTVTVRLQEELAAAAAHGAAARATAHGSAAGAAAVTNGVAGEGMLREIRMLLKWGHIDRDGLDDVELFSGAARGMTGAVDLHTQFFTAKERSSWNESLDPTYGGIGAYVNFDENEVFTIVRPIFGGPAYGKDLKPGDKVLRVDGWETSGQPQEEIVKRLRGIPGTTVLVTIYRNGWAEPHDIELTRGRITIRTAQAEILPNRIGYVRLTTFGKDTARELAQECRRLERDHQIQALILDLRWNSGGWLETGRAVADVFLPRGKLIVYWEGPNHYVARREDYAATQGTTRPDYPVVILVNPGSASASEIVAGALQTHGRARLIGERTYGKGTVQRIFPLTTSPPSEPFTDSKRRDGRYNPPEAYRDDNGNGRYDDGEDLIDLDRNGRWTDGEWFEDRNGDGIRQAGEPFTDEERFNGVHDADEPFSDLNANGRHDPREPYYDANRNQKYDPAEAYEDLNDNGKHDFAAVKITIGKYYLPNGRSLLRERKIVDGKVTLNGGIEPDVRIEQGAIRGWRAEEIRRLQQTKAFDAYLTRLYPEHREVFGKLAYDDGRDPSRYPEFEAFHASLKTNLEAKDVRWWLRQMVRRKVSDERGKEMVGDFLDDLQLRRAVKDLAETIGFALADVPEYRVWADEQFEDLGPEDD